MRTNITAALTSLSNGEKNRLEDANKISFSDLFGCEDSNDITVTSSDTDVVDVTSNSIVIKGTTTEGITLTVYSKKDYSKSQEFKFVVVNTISNFKNDVTGNVLNLQVGNTASINYSIKSSIYLGTSKVYDLVQDNYEITASYDNGVDDKGNSINKKNIDFTITGFTGTVAATGKTQVGSYNLKAILSVKGLADAYNDKIKSSFEDEFTLKTFKGARHIGVSNSQIVIYPSTTSSVNVTLTTDNVDGDTILFKIVKDLENIDGTTLTVSPENPTTEFTFKDADVNKIKVLKANKGNEKQEYVLTVSIDEKYKNKISEEETFYMIISSTSGTADNENFVVTIKLEPQDINHIDMTSYLHSGLTAEENTTVYHRKNQISSMLSPGNFSYMVIGVDPTYSYYEYFTIGAESSEGYYLNLTKMVPWKTLDAYAIDNSNEFSYLGNSIQVNPSKVNGRPEQYIFRVYASALTSLNVDENNNISTSDNRLLRRIIRDNRVRGITPEDTILRWPSVRRGEGKHIFPFQENADAQLNTALLYELPMLRYYAEPLLRRILPSSPAFSEARRLLKFLDFIVALQPQEIEAIPPTSIMREFIGGQTL